MFSLFRRNAPQAKPARRNPHSVRPLLEALEDRTLLSSGWAVSNGGSGTLSSLPTLSQPDAAGNLYVTGYFSGTATFGSTTLTASSNNASYVAKVDPNGNFLWAEQLGGAAGNTGWDGIALDSSGNVYVTGNFGGTAAFGSTTLTSAGGADIYVCKLDPSSGNVLWAQRAGGTNDDWGMKLAVDASGNVYLTSLYSVNGGTSSATFGTTTLAPATGNGGGSSIALSKLDARSGNFLWSERLSNTPGQLGGLTVDASGNVYVAGGINSTTFSTFLAKYDPNGLELWADTNLGTNGNLNNGLALAIFQDPVAGTTSVYDAGSGGNIQKVDASSGAVLWSEALGAPNYPNVVGRAAAVDANGNLYLAGQFSGTADFDPGTGTANLTSEGAYDAFHVKLDPSGNFLSARRSGGTQDDGTSGVALDSSGNVYTAGHYQGTADFDTGSQTVSLTSPGSTSLFLAKTTQDMGAIFGQVFNDLNNNGVFDPGTTNPETGIPNVTVYLDLNNSGSYVSGDPTAITNSIGQYEFNHLAAGSYVVRQVTPSGWTQTYPSAGGADAVTLGTGQFVETENFGDYTPSQTKSYASTNVPLKLGTKSGAAITSTLTVNDAATIFDLNVSINVTTTSTSLAFNLIAPDGTIAPLGWIGSGTYHVTVLNYHGTKGTWTLKMWNGASAPKPSTLNAWSLQILESTTTLNSPLTASPNSATTGSLTVLPKKLAPAQTSSGDSPNSDSPQATPSAAVSSTSNGSGAIEPSSTSIPGNGSRLSAVDQVLTNLAVLLSDARNAYQSELSSVATMWQNFDALALQRLDALLSMEARAMGLSKDALMRDFLLAS